MKADIRRPLIHKKRCWAGILLAQFLLFFILSKLDFFVQLVEVFFEWQKRFHQLSFFKIPFSVGDILYILLIIVFVFIITGIVRKINKYCLVGLISLNVIYFIYQLLWGMLYFQTPLIEKLPKEDITLGETKRLTEIYLLKCIEARKKVSEDEHGVFKIKDIGNIESEILNQQAQIPKPFNDKKVTGADNFKESLFSSLMGYSGILGYYNPFTSEAQYNAELPDSYQPFTLAHESAHQLGFAREQEANFIGYLIGIKSKNPELAYATKYYVLKSLLHALVEKHPEYVKEVQNRYSPGMKRDREAEKKYREAHRGFIEVVFGFTNDLFLKSNQQEGSITYSYFVDLLVRYERTQL